ncbi:MAG TPA: T9SS type A sorting domain-containing protein [Bacteroidia bacterium]
MKKIILAFIIAFTLNANAQTTPFYKNYDINTKSDFEETSDIILTLDSCYIVTCTSYDSTLSSATIELFKINSLGNVVWRQTFLCPNSPSYVNIAQAPDSGFVISSSYDYQLDTTTKVILIKTDKVGNKQWIKLLGDNTLWQTNYDMQIQGNSIFLLSCGSIKLGASSYQYAYFVTKTDLLGNVQWYKYYSWTDGGPFYQSFIVTKKKELYVSAETNTLGNEQFAISKIDSMGNLVWSKTYSPYNDIAPLNMLVDSMGNLIITGHMWTSNTNGWDIFLMKTDSLGNFKWGKTYGGWSSDEGWSVFQSQSGYVICAEPESFLGSSSRASLIKTDSVGNMQWMKIYGDTSGSFPNGALQLKNGFVIYGINGTYSSNSPIYLLKTDLNGVSSCKWYPVNFPDSSFTLTSNDTGYSGLVQGIMTYTLTEITRPVNEYNYCDRASIEEYNYLLNNFRVYPNPNNGSFVIELNSSAKQTMQVYDVNGKMVLSQVINGKVIIDASNLNEGVYNISIISNEGVVNKRVVIVR